MDQCFRNDTCVVPQLIRLEKGPYLQPVPVSSYHIWPNEFLDTPGKYQASGADGRSRTDLSLVAGYSLRLVVLE